MNKIISIELGIDLYYVISLSDSGIGNILCFPTDYNIDEVIEGVLLNIPISSTDDKLVYDKNGMGMMIQDTLLKKEYAHLLDIAESIEPKDFSKIVLTLVKAKDRLNDCGKNNNLVGFEYLEFKKLIDEINNLEISINPNGIVKLVKKDRGIGNTRATCFLNGLYQMTK